MICDEAKGLERRSRYTRRAERVLVGEPCPAVVMSKANYEPSGQTFARAVIKTEANSLGFVMICDEAGFSNTFLL